jgi:hypothetical protein
MVVIVAFALLLSLLQPAPSTPAQPAPPALPTAKPKPASALQPATPTPTLDQLEPASRKAVEKYAASFIVTEDGTYWDRQVWLDRQALRERLKRSASLPAAPTDAQRALGASKDAPTDPYDHADGIEWKEWQIKTGETKKGYRYGVDHTNPPLWRAVGGKTAITASEIDAARNARREKLPPMEQLEERKKAKVAPIRETVTPEELAVAIKEGKAELSEFRWVKRVINKAEPEKRNESGGVIHKAQPEEAEYSWVREGVAVKWKKGETK